MTFKIEMKCVYQSDTYVPIESNVAAQSTGGEQCLETPVIVLMASPLASTPSPTPTPTAPLQPLCPFPPPLQLLFLFIIS